MTAYQENYNVYPGINGEVCLSRKLTSPETPAASGPIRSPQDWGNKYALIPVTYFSAHKLCSRKPVSQSCVLGKENVHHVKMEVISSRLIQKCLWQNFHTRIIWSSRSILIWLTQCFPNCVPQNASLLWGINTKVNTPNPCGQVLLKFIGLTGFHYYRTSWAFSYANVICESPGELMCNKWLCILCTARH